MAPRIFTLLRSPVTGTWGGWPTRLQVACSVESCRKLASSVKINAQSFVWDFFLDSDTYGDASGPVGPHLPSPAPGAGAAPRSSGHAASGAHGRDGNGRQTLARSPRQSSAKSIFRYPDHRRRDRCREYPRAVPAAPPSTGSGARDDSPPTARRFRTPHNARAIPTPWIGAI